MEAPPLKYVHEKTARDYDPRTIYSDWRKRRAFDRDMMVPAKRCWRQARTLAERDGDDFAVYDYVFSFFPCEFTEEAQDLGLLLGWCSSKDMRRIISQARKDGIISEKHDFMTRTYGVFDSAEPSIDVVSGILPEKLLGIQLDWRSAADVIGHEFCHFADWICGNVSDASKSFHACYEAERNIFDCVTAASANEYFASAGWICLRYPQQAARHLPETFRWFENFWFGTELSRQRIDDIAEGRENPNADQERFWEEELQGAASCA